MRKQTHNIALLSLMSLVLCFTTSAQTPTPAASPRTVVVTFTFRVPVDEYATYSGEDNRFYVQVPASNIPSYRFDTPNPNVKLMVDNDKSNQETFVYWVPQSPGTSARVDKKGLTLVLTFSPPQSVVSRTIAMTPSASQPAPRLGGVGPAVPAAASPNQPATPAADPPSAFNPEKAPVASANIDLAVPESPAFTVLGLNPQTVTRPASPREFATSLLNGVDQNGNFQSGVALDFAPYQTLAGDRLTLAAYNKSPGLRLLARTQVSLATTKGATDNDKAMRLALGFHLTLWDRGDPHSDPILMKCFEDNLRFAQRPAVLPPDQLPPEAPETLKILSKQEWDRFTRENDALADPNNQGAEKCRNLARKRNWNKSSWIVAAAPSWISTSGQTKDFRWNGGGFWSSVAYGFEGVPGLEDKAQLIFHARYRNNELVPDSGVKGKFLNQNNLFLGTRLRAGSQNSTVNFEGVFIRSRTKGLGPDNSARFSLGLERKVAENMWFTLSFGGDRGRSDGKNNGFVLSSFKWGFSEKKSPVVK